MNKLIVYLVVALSIYSCKNSTSNRGYYRVGGEELGDVIEIRYREDTVHHRKLGDNSIIEQKGAFIYYHKNDNIDTVFKWGESVVIPAHIEDTRSDNQFLLVDQKPLNKLFGPLVIENASSRRLYWPKNFKEAEKGMKNSELHAYWIVDKLTDNIYGPFSLEEYFIARQKLGVPTNLRLKSEKQSIKY